MRVIRTLRDMTGGWNATDYRSVVPRAPDEIQPARRLVQPSPHAGRRQEGENKEQERFQKRNAMAQTLRVNGLEPAAARPYEMMHGIGAGILKQLC